MRRNMIKRCIDAINFRLRFYLKNSKRVTFLEVLESKGKLFLFMFFIYALIKGLCVYLSYFLKKPNNPIAKCVLFGQGRTGCSTLGELLSSHPQFQYDDEILLFNVFFPRLFIKAMCALSKKDIYGFKIKIYQLTKSQNIQDPKQFMHELYRQGWKIIYIKRRNLLHREVAALTAKSCRLRFKSEDTPSNGVKVYIDCKGLIERMQRRGMYLAQEEEILKNLPHITIVFEDDLLRAENHQRTLDKILDYLGLPSVPVKTIFLRAASKRLSDYIQNYEEVVRAISQTKYVKFLED